MAVICKTSAADMKNCSGCFVSVALGSACSAKCCKSMTSLSRYLVVASAVQHSEWTMALVSSPRALT